MLNIEYTAKFKKDYKLAVKRGCDIEELKKVITILQSENALPPKYHDHSLSGNYSGFRECHISPDWLLIYRIDMGILTLTLARTGSHSDLF
jgi:mRNA interferase YafQ